MRRLVEETMDSMVLHVTDHAYERGKERLGLNKKSLKRMSEKALELGMKLDDLTGSLYNYLAEKLEYEYYENSFFRIYGEAIYVFAPTKDKYFDVIHPLLVTVMIIPNELRKQACGCSRKIRCA